MAGIGFELRLLLRRPSLWALVRAYAYAGIISSGPWVLSILAVMGIGALTAGAVPSAEVRPFLVSVTYLMGASLIFTGPLQLMFTRFVADRLYVRGHAAVLPNAFGALSLTLLAALVVGTPLSLMLPGRGPRLLILAAFSVLSASWIAVVLLSGLKQYRRVLTAFVVGYAISFFAALALRRFGLSGLLGGFLAGQVVLLMTMVGLIAVAYPSDRLVAFDFLRRDLIHPSLCLTGLIYNLGIWIDKIIFWFTPSLSEPVLGPLRASVIYDLPIFLAYLSIVPGMAVFLVRVETDFAAEYQSYFDTVERGGTLHAIERARDRMALTVRRSIGEILKVQGVTVLVLLLSAPALLDLFGLSRLYVQLFSVDLVAVGMQVLMLAVFNVLFYLDQRGATLGLSVLFCASNAVFTLITQHLGPAFYGYGFALSTTLTSLVGLVVTSAKMDRLERDTFARS